MGRRERVERMKRLSNNFFHVNIQEGRKREEERKEGL